MQYLNKLQVTYSEVMKMGFGRNKLECQDSTCTMDRLCNQGSFFAIFDGHGPTGKNAAQAANYYIQTFLGQGTTEIIKKDESQNEDFLKSAFKYAEESLLSEGNDYSTSGTCVISVLIVKNMCYIANLGNSRAVLFRKTQNEEETIELSCDHITTRQDEQQRILSSGGQISQLMAEGQPLGPQRIWIDENGPGISATRAQFDTLSRLGNQSAKKIGLISEPEIRHIELTDNDQFIVIASDGVWDLMSSAEVCEFINKYEKKDSAGYALVIIYLQQMDECTDRQAKLYESDVEKNTSTIGDFPTVHSGRDDMSIIIIFLNFCNE